MIEYWDLYDEMGNKLEQKHQRGTPMPKDAYHLVIGAWVQNPNGQYLMSKRDSKKTYPGYWECTGGCAIEKETALEACIREVKEEVGITLSPNEGRRLGRKLRREHHDFYEVWLFSISENDPCIQLQTSEVAEAKWLSRTEILEYWKEKKLHPLLSIFPFEGFTEKIDSKNDSESSF